ncbi:hypothetical protein LOAG_15266, partial [Loa loa]
ELQTEPLDLTISRVCGGRIELPDASIAEVSGGQAELSETDHEDARSLNLVIQEASREQTGVRDMPKKIWLKRYENEASNNQILKRKHPENTTHTGEKLLKCEISKKDFVASPSTHTMNHTSEKPFFCSECNTSFSWLSYLDRHMKIHTGEKPYSCSECGKNFTQLSHLRVHEKIHTREKPHSCSKCGKNFSYLSNLRTHEEIHAGVKYPCLKCNKSFSQSGNMRRHMKVHGNADPDSVELYEKDFVAPSSTHAMNHRNEKLFPCSECNTSFIWPSHLNRHTKIHTGEK